ncbi:MAG TPA: GldG family protein [Candidatus Krumholzibacteriaceae bacterium]|nr:GldG family protein [Candidatus Krumholzibacteriaceae bacterium]
MRKYSAALRIISVILIAVSVILYTIFARSGTIIFITFFTGIIILISNSIFRYYQTGIEGHRRAARSRAAITLSVIIYIIIIILLQVTSARHNIKYDTTANKRFSLSPQTKKVLNGINEEIKITCFFSETAEEKSASEDLFKEYTYLNNNIKYQFINPDRDPMSARRYGIDSFGITVVESANGREKIKQITENSLTNAIYRATQIDKKNIYFTIGHGEKSVKNTQNNGISALAQALKSENYNINELPLATNTAVPSDCEVLIVAGPTRDILAPEKDLIDIYLKGGGNALFLIDPVISIPRITDIVSFYGIVIDNNVIVDRLGVLTSGTYLTPVINRYSDHPITRGFKYFSFFPQARSISKADDPGEDYEVNAICFTNKKAYGERDIDLILNGKTRFDEGIDKPGPLSLAATSRVLAKEKFGGYTKQNRTPRIAVYGDSDFLTNKIINLYGNRDLIMNTLNWLARERDLVSIRPENQLVQPVLLTMIEGRLVFWLSAVVMPALIAIIGSITLARKRRNSESN